MIGGKGMPAMRVVSHHPWRRAAAVLAVIAVCAGGALAAFQLGRATAELDDTYLSSVERLNQVHLNTIEQLEAQLVEADLTRDVGQEATLALKEDIRLLKDEVAALTEEVTFYKSLMAPSSLAKGLQIAEFELTAMEEEGRYRFHLLLTQVETRRDWVQGEASLEVAGRMSETGGTESATERQERVLRLTEIGEDDSYPLKFRFRYFQDLSGVISLPPGFEPESIVVTAGKRNAQPLSRTFDWTVAG